MGKAKVSAKKDVVKIAFVLTILLCLSAIVILRVSLVSTMKINEDEFMHLQWSWAMTEGRMPYRDFMMAHTPLPQFLLMPLFSFYDDDPNIIFAGRIYFSGFALMSLVMLYLLGKGVFDRRTAWLAVVFCAGVGAYAIKSVEVRPDVVGGFLGLLTLYLLSREDPPVFLAGLCTGLALVNNQKFVAMAAFIGLGVLFLIGEDWKKKIASGFHFGLGASIPLLVFLAWLLWNHGFHGFVRDNVHSYLYGGNVGAKAGWELNVMRWTFLARLIYQNLPLSLAAILGGIAILRDKKRRRGFIFPALYLAAMMSLFFLTFVHEMQNSLYLVPPVALLAAAGAMEIWKKVSRKYGEAGRALILTAIVLVIFASSFAFTFSNLDQTNEKQIRTWKYILKTVSPRESVMDGHAGMFVFRHNALYYHATAFADARAVFDSFFSSEKAMTEFLIHSIKEERVKLIIMEDVFEDVLPEGVQKYIHRNFRRVEGYSQPLYLRK